MWYQIGQYFQFLVKSKNHHGVHSPFVFDLVTKCFYNKNKYDDYNLIKNYRNQLLNNKSSIYIKDFGAGSKIFKTNQRSVSQIVKTAGISTKRSQLLYRIAQYFEPDTILELGTSLGLATSTLSLGNPNAKVITIEGCPETAKIAQEQFKRFKFKNINLKVNNFDDELKTIKNKKFDLIYIDGNHQKEATLKYFMQLQQNISNNSVIIIDDIHWSKGMTEAWNTIKKLDKATLTIDTFFWGIVFFRKEQTKQHFLIRM